MAVDRVSKVKWIESKVDQLIEVFQNEILLYDVKNCNYHDRDKKDEAWHRIANSVGVKK